MPRSNFILRSKDPVWPMLTCMVIYQSASSANRLCSEGNVSATMPAKSNADGSRRQKVIRLLQDISRDDTAEWWISSCEFLTVCRPAGARSAYSSLTANLWRDPYEYEDGRTICQQCEYRGHRGPRDWWLFETDAGTAGLLFSLKTSGLRTRVAYWIIHSCEVIPTQDDESTSFDVWWQIFNGLHAW